MSNKNKNKYNKLPTQPIKLEEQNYNTKPVITSNVISEVIEEPVFSHDTVATEQPVESKNIRKEYKLVSIRGNAILLQDEVNKQLSQGWELAGGVSTTMYMDGYTATPIWSQALIKDFSN